MPPARRDGRTGRDTDGRQQQDDRRRHERTDRDRGDTRAGDDGADRAAGAAIAAAVGRDAHDAAARAGVPRLGIDPGDVAEVALAGGVAHGPERHPEQAPPPAPRAATAAQPLASQVVTADEPAVEPGEDVGGGTGHLLVDHDDRRAEQPVADVARRRRPEVLDGDGASHRGLRDAHLGGRRDERLGVDVVDIGESGSGKVVEGRGPTQDAAHGVTVERGVVGADVHAVRCYG